MGTPYCSTPLTTGWSFKQGHRDSDTEYLQANDVPTEIHLDLLKHHKIADPFDDLNELSVRWVGEKAWTYRTNFAAPQNHGEPGVKTVLTFTGLDTFAAIYLNGDLILESQNMFVESTVDVTQALLSTENVLEVEFESARQKGLQLVEEHKEHRFIVHQTEISRGPVRKAQYDWGWDWGPILMTCGPWKPIILETFTSRIVDLWIEYTIGAGLKTVEGNVLVKIEGEGELQAKLLSKDEQDVVAQMRDFQSTATKGVFSARFKLQDVRLWWPRGYGSQTLYTVTAALRPLTGSSSVDTTLHTVQKSTGFRKAQLMQEPDTHGTSFYFRINDIDVFCGGSCWIPTDSFLTRIDAPTYHAQLTQAAEGNQAMVRVWGGGIYEDTAFYDAADALGLLIWQDFAFACASYPAHATYLSSVELEATQNVRRLRNHPSLVIWAGNNEDYQIVERYGLEYDFVEDKDPQSWLKTNFPARYIYEYLLPKVVAHEAKGVAYHPSSPFGNGTSTTLKVDPTVGDVHQWNVWHGNMEPYQRLPRMGGRFVSEFGMEAYPHVSTLEKCIAREEERVPGSMTMDFRNKAIGHERRLVSYIAENFKIRYDLEGYTHLTQVMQADALTWAYKGWRREWKGDGDRKCGGVLVWQLNDCWPTMSWAVVDYYGVPKPGYYAIKRSLEPVVVGVQRKMKDWTVRPADQLWQRDTSHIDMRAIWGDIEFDVWVASSLQETLEGHATIRFISIASGREVARPIERAVTVHPNGTTDLVVNEKVEVPDAQDPDQPFEISRCDPFVILAILDIEGREVMSDVSWPDPIKYLNFADRGVKVECLDDGKRIAVSADRPIKGFVFSEQPGMKLGDNGFDVMPGAKKEIRVQGCNAHDLKWRYIDMP